MNNDHRVHKLGLVPFLLLVSAIVKNRGRLCKLNAEFSIVLKYLADCFTGKQKKIKCNGTILTAKMLSIHYF